MPLKDAVVNTLSGGEQQRTALARTMLNSGQLIITDEPTGTLDTHSAEISFLLLQNLCKKYQKTVVMVTHSPELAAKTDSIIHIRNL